MPTYSVDMPQVDTIVGEMNAITQRITQTLSDLENQAQSSLSEWTSDARNVYTEVKAQWDAAAAEMARLAGNATTTLGNINGYYGDGERKGVQIWGN
ncbi:WXG100 family type VII secretion target [Streptomyces hyaluromycini]|uniref:WXG100 family type VII secretion target n=1 Tax=Streptomyces hyaluromycini TaxID=1377993 RepID=A0ABV1XFS7_9ACTN